jgi:hypothetical protein
MEKKQEHKPSPRLLQIIESEIREHARRQGIINPYWYFAELLGYKSKNSLYDWFSSTGSKKIGYADLWVIIRETHSKTLIKAVINDIKEALENE